VRAAIEFMPPLSRGGAAAHMRLPGVCGGGLRTAEGRAPNAVGVAGRTCVNAPPGAAGGDVAARARRAFGARGGARRQLFRAKRRSGVLGRSVA
jgi:hypothetical protein